MGNIKWTHTDTSMKERKIGDGEKCEPVCTSDKDPRWKNRGEFLIWTMWWCYSIF